MKKQPLTTTMTHLFRGALFLVLLFLATDLTPALGQRETSKKPSVDPAPPSNCVWAAATAVPTNIMDQAVTSLGNNLYTFAGVGNGAIIANSYKFDGTTWTSIAPYPIAVESPSAVSDGTQFIYIMNGVSTGPVYQTAMNRYDPVANTYTAMAPNTVATWNQAAVYLNGKIYKMGGYNSAAVGQTALEIYTVASNTWAPGAPIPTGTGFPSAFAQGNFIYYAGGIGTVGSNLAYRYDVAANTWSAIANLPATRWGAASAFYGDSGVLAGGYVGADTATSISATAIYYNAGSNMWVSIADMLLPRGRMNGATRGNSFYVIGGRPNGDTGFTGSNGNQQLTCAFTPVVISAAGAAIQAEGCTPTNGAIDPGEAVTVSFCVQNPGTQNSTNLVGTLQATGGVTNPGGPQTYGVVVAGGPAVCRNFTFTADPMAACGGSLVATIHFQDGATDLGNVTYSFTLGTTSTSFSENFDAVTPPALPAGWTADQGVGAGTFPLWVTSNSGTPTPPADSLPNSAYTPDPNNLLDNRIYSPVFTYNSAAVRLSFRNNYNLEQQNATTAYDAGVLEINTNNTGWMDIITAGGTFVSGGYDHTAISTGFANPLLPTRPCWSGNSGGFITTVVTLPAAGVGQNVQLRWRMGSDNSVAVQGWRIDSVTVSQPLCASCNAPQVSSAVSRKTHSVTAFDIDLPLSGTPGIECRTGGATNDYSMVVTFANNITVNGSPQAQVTMGAGTIGTGGVPNGGMVTVSANIVTIPLTNVTNAQTINVTLFGVTSGTSSGNVVIPMSTRIGDTNGNGAVNSSDVAQTKGRAGQALSTTNFRSDVNANGAINSADISIIKSNIP